MNKLLLMLGALCVGAIGFGALHRVALQSRTITEQAAKDWMATTNQLVEIDRRTSALSADLLTRKHRLQDTTRHPQISSSLLALLDNDTFTGSPAAWAELRRQLDLGWDASPDYVLVSKRVLKQLDYTRLLSAARIAGTACELLGISPAEKTALEAALQRTSQQWQGLTVDRAEPNGDILAQYTVRPPDPSFELGLSNSFSAQLLAAVGTERAQLLLPDAWRELRSDLGPTQPETLTIRRSLVEGDPDLVYEMKRGAQTWSDPVRYARYPSSWFLALFPGGWKTLAEKEGFPLPQKFQN